MRKLILIFLALLATFTLSANNTIKQEIYISRIQLTNRLQKFDLNLIDNQYVFSVNKADMIKFINHKHFKDKERYLRKYYQIALKTILETKKTHINISNRLINPHSCSDCIRQVFKDYIETGNYQILDYKTKKKLKIMYLSKYKQIIKSSLKNDHSKTESDIYKLPNSQIIFYGRMKASISCSFPEEIRN